MNPLTPWLWPRDRRSAGWRALACGLCLSLTAAAQQPVPGREVVVPAEDLRHLLHGANPRVLLPRAEYEALRKAAEAQARRSAPITSVVARVDSRLRLVESEASVQVEAHLDLLHPGLHAVPFALAGVDLLAADLDGKPAPIGRGAEGHLVVFAEGPGRKALRLHGRVALTTTSARQDLRMALPVAGASTLSLESPGDVEIKSGAAVIRREFDAGAETTRFEIAPPAGEFTLSLSLNNRQKRRQPVVTVNSAQVSRIARSHEEWRVSLRISVRHFGLRALSFALPERMDVLEAASPAIESWRVEEQAGGRKLVLGLRDDQPGELMVELRGARALAADGAWSMPMLRPLEAAAHASVLGLWLESGQRLESSAAEGLLAGDRDLLQRLLAGLGQDGDTAGGVWFAPQGEGRWHGRLSRPAPELRVISHGTLTASGDGWRARLGLTLEPRRQWVSRAEIELPAGWTVLGVGDGEAKPWPHETRPLDGGGQRLTVHLPQGVPDGGSVAFLVEAERIPEDWMSGWSGREEEMPVWPVAGATRQTGALVALGVDDIAISPSALRGMTPMDEQERKDEGIPGDSGSPAYRYESVPASATFRLRRLAPRLSAEHFVFSRVEPDQVRHQVEVLLRVVDAGLRSFTLRVPASLPETLQVDGSDAAGVRAWRVREVDGARELDIELDRRATDQARVVLSWPEPLAKGVEAPELDLPWVRTVGAAYQSTRVCLEGHPELETSVLSAPRAVDVGELADAVTQPGNRVVGVFAYAGDPPPMRIRLSRPGMAGLPVAVAEQADLETALDGLGAAQTRAKFRLRTRADFLEVQLPAGAVFWSALFAGQPLQPSQRGDTMVFDLPPGADATEDLEIVYDSGGGRMGSLTGRFREEPPTLWIPETPDHPREAVPVLQSRWRLFVPEHLGLIGSRGAMAPDAWQQPEPAALRLGRLLYTLAGGINPNNGLAGCSLGLSSAVTRKAIKSEKYRTLSEDQPEALIAGVVLSDEGSAVAGRPQSDLAPPARPAAAPQRAREVDAKDMRQKEISGLSAAQAATPPATAAPGKPKQNGKDAVAWYEKGLKGLQIDLVREGRRIEFHALQGAGNLDASLMDHKRGRWLAWAAGLSIFVAGMARDTRRLRFLLLALAVSSVVPALPGALALTTLGNGAFTGAALLVPGWLALGLLRRVLAAVGSLADRLRPLATPTMALLCAGSFLLDDTRAAEDGPPTPVAVPDSVLLIPYGPEQSPAEADRVLVPYPLYLRWLELASTRDASPSLPPAVPFAWSGLEVTVALGTSDTLTFEGSAHLNLFVDGPVAIPLRLSPARWSSARLDDRSAALRARSDAPDNADYELTARGRGPHVFAFSAPFRVQREGGWRTVAGILPGAPASVLRVRVPEAGVEIHSAGNPEPRVTGKPGEVLDLPLAADGSFSLRWRPRLAAREVDRSLTVQSFATLDFREDQVRLTWEASFQFRNGQRSSFDLDLPEGFRLDAVEGANVRGWDSDAATPRRITVNLLKPAETAETFTLRLWRAATTRYPVRESLPFVSSPEALRQTGGLALRSSPWLEVRCEPGEGLRRRDLDDAQVRARPLMAAETGPLGLTPREQHEFVRVPFEGSVELRETPLEVKAQVRTLLQADPREHRLEASLIFTTPRRPLRDIRVALPAGFEPETVRGVEGMGWQVEAHAEGRDLVVALPRGIVPTVEIVASGPLRAETGPVALPRLVPRAAPEAEQSWVVQTGADFDVSLDAPVDLEQVPASRIEWLRPEMRAAARIGLRADGPAPSGRIALTRRQAKVFGSVFTSARFTDRSIEETHLIEYRVEQAGTRRLRFALPEHLAKARIQAPLVRQQEIAPPAGGEVEVTLDLLESVTGAYRVLVEHDRVLSTNSPPLRLARLLEAETDRRFIAVEGAGRDELEWMPSPGLDFLGSQQKDWARMRAILAGRINQAYQDNGKEPSPHIGFTTRARQAVQTSGARIGLAESLLVVDEAGAYHGRQVYHLDNRTESWLEVELPAGAALHAAKVAGVTVKPAAGATRGLIRLPLVKTSAGDLDYQVELVYGGVLDRSPGLRATDLPLPATRNISAELSQAEVRLPRSRTWFGFEGAMRPLENAADFEAGRMAYQKDKALLLFQCAQTGQEFERARAMSNLKVLEVQITDNIERNKGNLWNANVAKQQEELSKVVQQVRDQQQVAQTTWDAEGDNRAVLNDAFFAQGLNFARNTAGGAAHGNFRGAEVAAGEAIATGDKLDAFVVANGFIESKPTSGPAEAPAKMPGGAKKGDGTLTLNRANLDGAEKKQNLDALRVQVYNSVSQVDARLGDQQRAQGQELEEGQKALAKRYQQKLEQQQQGAVQSYFGFNEASQQPANQPITVSGGTLFLGGSASQTEVRRESAGRQLQRADADAPADRGLQSLDLNFPPADPAIWSSFYFATPRGKTDIQARAVAAETLSGLRRAGLVLAVLLGAGLLARFAGSGPRDPASARKLAGAGVLVAMAGLLTGVFPVAALLLLLGCLVVRFRARRQLRALAA